MMSKEHFQPIANTSPDSTLNTLKFYGRMALDFQILSIYQDVKKVVPSMQGKVLDVGCGDSPYQFLLDPSVEYKGIDVNIADDFKYKNDKITVFDGKHIPFEDNTFDGIMCTEVLEHCEDFQILVNEMFRVCKKGATGVITIPWSARFHYIPYDYFRYTPSTLKKVFSAFEKVEIRNRGTDINAICSKIIVLFFRNLIQFRNPLTFLLAFVFSPIVLVPAVLIGHIAYWFSVGSDDDPLGYTVYLKK
jgi:SAM-dependent methyltransferase